MASAEEKKQEIFTALRVAADAAKHPVLDIELVGTALRLEQYHGIELFRIIASLPGRNYFPAAVQIEDEIRKVLGLDKKASPPGQSRKGVPTESDIQRVEREAVVSGQKPSQARAGAELMRKSREAAEKKRIEREALISQKKGPPTLESVMQKITAPEPAPVEEVAEDLNALLESFDQETLDGAIDSF